MVVRGKCAELKRTIEDEYREVIDVIIQNIGKCDEKKDPYRCAQELYSSIKTKVGEIERDVGKAVRHFFEPPVRTLLETLTYEKMIKTDSPGSWIECTEDLLEPLKKHTEIDFLNSLKKVLEGVKSVIEGLEKANSEIIHSKFQPTFFKADAIYGYLQKLGDVFSEFNNRRYGFVKSIENIASQSNFLNPKFPGFLKDLDLICERVENTIMNEVYNPEEDKYQYASYHSTKVTSGTIPVLSLLEKSEERNHGPLKLEKVKDGEIEKYVLRSESELRKTSGVEIVRELWYMPESECVAYAVVVKTPDWKRFGYARKIKEDVCDGIYRSYMLAEKIACEIYRTLRESGLTDYEILLQTENLPRKIYSENITNIIFASGLDEKLNGILKRHGINIHSERKRKGKEKAMEILNASEYILHTEKLGEPYRFVAGRVFAEEKGYRLIPIILGTTKTGSETSMIQE